MTEKKEKPAGRKNKKPADRKKNERARRTGDLLLQLAVVVAGILITFQGSAWIEKRQQRRETREILTMVAEEMQDNLVELERCRERVGRELAGMDFFARHMGDIRSAPADTLAMYSNVLDNSTEFHYSSNALEVLKTSSSAVNTVNKRLLRSIFRCYDNLGNLFGDINSYYEYKVKIIGDLYFSIDRAIVEAIFKGGDPYPYLQKFMDNVSTGNLVLNTQGNIGYDVSDIEKFFPEFRETIAALDNATKK